MPDNLLRISLARGLPWGLVVAFMASLVLALGQTAPAYGAGLVVNSTADTTVPGDGNCTLREAITNANANSDTTSGDCPAGSGADVITFSVTGVIHLGSELPAISNNLTITGPGAASLTISGDTDGNGSPDVPILRVDTAVSFTLGNVTLAKGNRAGSQGGGGIRNIGGTVNVIKSTLSGNNADTGGGIWSTGAVDVTNSTFSANSASFGGGIFNVGKLTISGSTFSSNNATVYGGGIASQGEKLTVTDSTFSGNTAPTQGGGGIQNHNAMTVTNSTFSGNTAREGGGINNNNGGRLTIISSTISGNSASIGGGILNFDTLTVTNSTIAGNGASTGGGILNFDSLAVTNSTISGNSAGSGGGISNVGATTLGNTIVANSTLGGNCSGTITDGGGNLSYPDTTCPGINADPKLGPLADNGGPTRTMALLPGSAAIDTGVDAICAAAPVNNLDQRGFPRPRDGDGNSTAVCDMGAYEAGFNLRGPVPGVAGVTNAFEVSGAPPGSQVLFLGGSLPGPIAVPGCAGATIDIGSPKLLARVIADANGNADLSVLVPLSASGRTVRLQAVQQASCKVSNLVVHTFP